MGSKLGFVALDGDRYPGPRSHVFKDIYSATRVCAAVCMLFGPHASTNAGGVMLYRAMVAVRIGEEPFVGCSVEQLLIGACDKISLS